MHRKGFLTASCFSHLLIMVAVSFGLVLLGAFPAEATIDNQKSFKSAYPDVKKVNCMVCHIGKIGKKGDLNAYGQALVEKFGEGNAKALTEDDYHAIDDGDADGDGLSNADEIRNGGAPGDAETKPGA